MRHEAHGPILFVVIEIGIIRKITNNVGSELGFLVCWDIEHSLFVIKHVESLLLACSYSCSHHLIVAGDCDDLTTLKSENFRLHDLFILLLSQLEDQVAVVSSFDKVDFVLVAVNKGSLHHLLFWRPHRPMPAVIQINRANAVFELDYECHKFFANWSAS